MTRRVRVTQVNTALVLDQAPLFLGLADGDLREHDAERQQDGGEYREIQQIVSQFL